MWGHTSHIILEHRLEEFLRRRARLQRVEEAVNRNVVVGFFDTLYWTRRFRRAMDIKRNGRMTAIPQFTVPEIYVDDEETAKAHGQQQLQPQQRGRGNSNGGTVSPTFSPVDLSPLASPSLDGPAGVPDLRSPSPPSRINTTNLYYDRPSSIQISPTASPRGSPTRGNTPTASPHHSRQNSDFRDWQFANALSRPPSPLEPDASGTLSPGGRGRANSSVSAQDALDVFDNSAWGESIRRSFTLRRPGGSGGGGSGGGSGR